MSNVSYKKSRRNNHRGPWVEPDFIRQYREGFNKHYPHYTCAVRPRRQTDGSIGYMVSINGSTDGSRPLSQWEMMEATRSFNA